ncbi:MAG: trehalose-phosphatase [Hyphomicrobiales bacterium]|nr:trehalose-phosphatase [Hyphomicrobiales bacterium]MCP5373345.1 trehalose-phosphatase [Hyphomicrobiales bacterium]
MVNTRIGDIPNALDHRDELRRRTAGKHLAVFLDYDGTLTPIAERPEDAILSDTMRAVVRDLAHRCTVAIVSGRDRHDVEDLVGIDDLIYAGSHGFDIASPGGRTLERREGTGFGPLLAEVDAGLRRDLAGIDGVLIELKKASVAVHYRLVAADLRGRVTDAVQAVLAAHDDLKMTPGKMVCEIQPRLDWDKGKAVLYMLQALDLDKGDVLPLYFGDDITDEDAFAALKGRGIGVFVGDVDNPEVAGRHSAADYRLEDPEETGRLLSDLAA